jgi:hypothetical protein
MRILICGDRNWLDKQMIKDLLFKLDPEVVIEGECKGADNLAKISAEELGIKVAKFPANWQKYGRAAGPIRNGQMIIEGKPTLVVAFHDDIERSKGTKNMLLQAKKAGITTMLLSHKA